jgi:hypothetical protein
MALDNYDSIKNIKDGFQTEKELREWAERVKGRENTLLRLPNTIQLAASGS